MNYTFIDKQKVLFKRLSYLRSNSTDSEKATIKILDELKIKYIFQKGFLEGDYYCIVDFYIPKPYKICLEVDGLYHEFIKERDMRKENYLRNYRNFNVLRIKNEDVSHQNIYSLLKPYMKSL